MEDSNQASRTQITKPVKSPKKLVIFLLIIVLLLVAATAGTTYLYYQEKNKQPATIAPEQTNESNTTTTATPLLNLDYFEPITKDGVTFFYPKDWPEPKVESANAQGFVTEYMFGVEIAYQYDAYVRAGNGAWICTGADQNKDACAEGVIYYPKTARKERNLTQQNVYKFTTVFDFSSGEINNAMYKFTVPYKDKMVTLTIPTICNEQLPEFPCEANAFKATDKTEQIIDDIVAYVKTED